MSKRILLVEDSRSQALRIKLELLRLGLEVEIATTGKQGLVAAQTKAYDLIILDIDLPELDGYSVCRALKDDPQTAHVPVLMLTQHDEGRDIIAGLQLGVIDYIPKDAFAEENLIASLHEIGIVSR